MARKTWLPKKSISTAGRLSGKKPCQQHMCVPFPNPMCSRQVSLAKNRQRDKNSPNKIIESFELNTTFYILLSPCLPHSVTLCSCHFCAWGRCPTWPTVVMVLMRIRVFRFIVDCELIAFVLAEHQLYNKH